MKAVHSKVIALKDTARLAKSINWQLNRSYITKNDLMVLDLVAHNNWSRPIYFAVTTGSDAYVGLEDYFQLEGLAYRFVPIKATEREQAEGGRVNTDAMYDNIMHKFQWGGMDKKGVNLDENCIRMATNMRVQMATLANALISEGKRSKAKEVLDKCIEKMPDENVPYDASLFTVVAGYYQLGENDKANDLAKKLFTIMEGDLKVYNAQKGIHRAQYNREMDQAKLVMRRLVSMAMQFKQDALAKEFMERFSLIVPREEMQQQGQPQGEPEPALQ